MMSQEKQFQELQLRKQQEMYEQQMQRMQHSNDQRFERMEKVFDLMTESSKVFETKVMTLGLLKEPRVTSKKG